jgi:hypothetical protein
MKGFDPKERIPENVEIPDEVFDRVLKEEKGRQQQNHEENGNHP